MSNKIFIPIISKKYGIKVLTVDLDDWNGGLKNFCWSIIKDGNNFYAITKIYDNNIPTSKRIHNYILNNNPLKKPMINHKDGNGLNNSKHNLEYCNNRENQSNQKNRLNKKSSKYTGVSWNKLYKKWRADIRINGKLNNLGHFDTELEAYQMYQKAVLKGDY